VFGNAGHDYIYGFLGNDLLIGGDGHDRLYGEQGNDTLSGGTGNDSLSGGEGNDVLEGNGQDDFLTGGAGADIIDGGAGSDTVNYYGSSVGVVVNLAFGTATGGEATGDTIVNVENIYATNFADILVGDDGANRIRTFGGNDVIVAQDGDDIILPGKGDDVVNGGEGFDIVSYEDFISGNGFVIDLQAGTATRTTMSGRWFSDQHDGLYSIEGAIGSDGNDTITGSDRDNLIEGNFGDDLLDGAEGNDRIDGGSGFDTMTGGADTFIFTVNDLIQNGGPNWGEITDFSAAEGDLIDLSELPQWYGDLEFIGTDAFSITGWAEIRIAQQGFGTATLHVDVYGNGEVDGIIEVTTNGFSNLSADDFVL